MQGRTDSLWPQASFFRVDRDHQKAQKSRTYCLFTIVSASQMPQDSDFLSSSSLLFPSATLSLHRTEKRPSYHMKESPQLEIGPSLQTYRGM